MYPYGGLGYIQIFSNFLVIQAAFVAEVEDDLPFLRQLLYSCFSNLQVILKNELGFNIIRIGIPMGDISLGRSIKSGFMIETLN